MLTNFYISIRWISLLYFLPKNNQTNIYIAIICVNSGTHKKEGKKWRRKKMKEKSGVCIMSRIIVYVITAEWSQWIKQLDSSANLYVTMADDIMMRTLDRINTNIASLFVNCGCAHSIIKCQKRYTCYVIVGVYFFPIRMSIRPLALIHEKRLVCALQKQNKAKRTIFIFVIALKIPKSIQNVCTIIWTNSFFSLSVFVAYHIRCLNKQWL